MVSWDLQEQSLFASVSAKSSTAQLEEPKTTKWYKKEKRKVKVIETEMLLWFILQKGFSGTGYQHYQADAEFSQARD